MGTILGLQENRHDNWAMSLGRWFSTEVFVCLHAGALYNIIFNLH